MAKPLLCPECGATITAGRLSCQECGTLLAAVVDARPRVRQPSLPPAHVAVQAPAIRTRTPVPNGEPRRARAPKSSREHPKAGGAVPTAIGPDVRVSMSHAPGPAIAVTPSPMTVGWSAALPPAGPPMPASATFEPGVPFAAVGAGDAVSGNGAPAPSDARRASEASSGSMRIPGRASLWADLPFDAPNDLPGWLVAIGGAVAAFSFLLPWAARGHTLIGDTTLELNPGYIDSWGLAVPTSALLVAVALALFVLAVWPNRIPRWIAGGLLPLIGGGLFLGIDWTYTSASSAFGGGVGLSALLAGAGFLIAGGILEVRRRRHEHPQPGV